MPLLADAIWLETAGTARWPWRPLLHVRKTFDWPVLIHGLCIRQLSLYT
jgi:hypothetical protein